MADKHFVCFMYIANYVLSIDSIWFSTTIVQDYQHKKKPSNLDGFFIAI